MLPAKRYDVVLSYAEEDRDYAKEFVNALRRRNVEVYDKDEQLPYLEQDLHAYLTNLYWNEARHCVVLLSGHYIANPQTMYELEIAQERARKDASYLFYVRLDNTVIPGLSMGRMYNALEASVGDIIEDLMRKTGMPDDKRSRGSTPSTHELEPDKITPPKPGSSGPRISGPLTSLPPQQTKDQWLNTGDDHLSKGKYEKALEAYKQAIDLVPKDDSKDAKAYRGKCKVLNLMGKYEEADEAHEQADKLENKSSGA